MEHEIVRVRTQTANLDTILYTDPLLIHDYDSINRWVKLKDHYVVPEN